VPADQNDANQSNNVLAMKLIRNNDTMAKAAVKEVRILRLLCGSKSSKKADSTESEAEELARNHNIVRLLEITNNGIDFEGKVGRRMQQQQSSMSLPPLEYRNHTTLLFEHMPYNLRETLAKFGKNVGINLTAVRSYSKQLFRALAHLAKHAVCHADIKPDNILVSADFSTVKLCDFGSAFFETDSDNVPTPYLVSRFYRAPEIILGLDYNRAVDLWSIAVTLAELFTGSVLFPGRTNNDMLKRFVDTMGPFSNKILRRHCASYSKMGIQAHFEAVPGGTYSFRRQELDKVTGRPVVKIVPKMEVNPNKQLSRLLLKSRSGSDDRADVLRFADLLSKCLSLDPARRLGVREAWDHEFLSGKKKH
jgi:serine/threonine-protein kinase PRP4